MAFILFKALGLWIHNTILIILLYFVDFQKIVAEPNYEQLKNKGIFMLFSFYFLSTILLHIFKMIEKSTDIKIKKETLKAKEEIRKYIENKNKKNL
jgi:hypothetical protein